MVTTTVEGDGMRVGIIGAGIGGLCAAVGLHRAGAEVTVFEQAPSVRAGGSGISVFGNGLRALDAIGVGDAFREISSSEAARFTGGQRRPDGAWLKTFPADAVTELRVVDREPLHEILLSPLPGSAVRTEAKVTAVSPAGSVSWSDGSGGQQSEDFDLVIAADGIGSRVRRSFQGDPGIAYSGYSAWRGITRHPIDLDGEAGETWGTRKRFGIVPLKGGYVYWFAVLSVAEGHRFADNHAALREHFGGWHAPIAELIEATDADRIGYQPISDLGGRLPSYTRGRIALLGDAAHAMTPNLGQGGGQAMEDAATITALLAPIAGSQAAPTPAIRDALERYNELRVKRTQSIAARSRIVGQLAHAPGGRLTGARDLLLKATPTAALRMQLTSIQGWRPPSS